MTYRKTWFSYVLWVVYTMLCVIFLFFAGSYICVSCLEGLGNRGVPAALGDSTIQISGLLAFPSAAALYWIIRVISGQIQKKCVGRKINWRILEGAAVWAFLALGIFLRVRLALDSIQLQNAAESSMQTYINGMEYFDLAAVTAGGSVEPMAYGGAYLYVVCLSFVLSFLGNKAAAAVMFQVFLQIAGLVLAYGVTRKMTGGLPACVVLLYLSCSPAYLEMLKNLGPESFFFVLYMIGLLAVVSFVKGYCARKRRKLPVLAGAVGAGALIGILGYLDLAAVTILIVAMAVAAGKKYWAKENEPAEHSVRMNAAVIATVIAACAAGFMLAAAVFSAFRGTDIGQELESWAVLHVRNTRTFGFRPLYPYSLDILFFSALAAMASFLVFEFFRRGREQNYMLWILLCIVAAPTPLAVLGVQPFGLISMYIWGVLAGLGVQNCIFGGRAGIMKSMIEEISRNAEEAERAAEAAETADTADTEAGCMEEISVMEEAESGETEPAESQKSAEGTEQKPAEETEKKSAEAEQKFTETAQEAAAEQEPAKPRASAEVQEEETAQREAHEQAAEEKNAQEPSKEPVLKKRYIENPLPLPKKHVHRKMDYQYIVEEKDMKYDVEIGEDDDFDI